MQYHNPVLLQSCIEGLQIDPDGIYVDVTFGGGGHSREILKNLRNGRLIAFDQDPDARQNAINDPRFTLIPQNFRYLRNFLAHAGALPVNGILADLGVSSHQFDVADRGFSIRFNSRLDMRMNPQAGIDAVHVLNEYDEEGLTRIFREYGELPQCKKIARAILAFRQNKRIETGEDLKDSVVYFLKKGHENKFLARLYQAIRIEVNGEIEVLKEFLQQSVSVLKPGGRLVVISYHSLEDQLVKNFMKHGKFFGEAEKDIFGNVDVPLRMITRKPIVPDENELNENTRSRSAKLRIAEKT